MRSTAARLPPSQLSWWCRAASALMLPDLRIASTHLSPNHVAGVRRNRASHLGVPLCCWMSCHHTPMRALLGSRGASTTTTTPIAEQCPTADADVARTALNEEARENGVPASAGTDEVQQLRQQVNDLKEALEANREVVKQLSSFSAADSKPFVSGKSAARTKKTKRALTAASVNAKLMDFGMHRQGACYLVRTSDELADALRGHSNEDAWRTVVLDGEMFILNPCAPVVVDRSRVFIVGNNATIVGQIVVKGQGSVFSASDVFFLRSSNMRLISTTHDEGEEGTSAETSAAAVPVPISLEECHDKSVVSALMPVISATVGASVHLDHCTLSSGRDGIYLGMGSHCTLTHVRIVNCIRGIYEGVGCCTSTMSDCIFQSNRYHMVLLGSNNSERAAKIFSRASSTGEAAVTSTDTNDSPAKEAYTAVFTTSISVADVLPPGFTSDTTIKIQETKAQVVLQHNPITDTYEDCWCDGARVELSEQDATAGLSDPLF